MSSSNTPPSDPGWLTLPNAITLVRFILVLPICWLLIVDRRPVLTLVLLAVFGASDWVDGFLARRLNQVSRFGALFDPIADRTGVALISVAFVVGGHLPVWVAIVIAGTDIVLGVYFVTRRGVNVPETAYIGKVRTAVLMTGLALVAFGRVDGLGLVGLVGLAIVFLGAVMHILVGVMYAGQIHRASLRR